MKKEQSIDIDQAVAPGLARRLAAMLYDTLLVFGLLLLASMVVTVPVGILAGEQASQALAGNLLFQLWLALVPPAFFLLFWLKGGQTLGMRSWRLRVVREDGAALTGSDALKRLLYALLSWLPLGLGFLWIVVDRDRLAWHDRLSHTRLVLLKKR
ncbi:RDD family protein [Sedimenticola thiotaurini]|uniref:Transporter n=1 Tax=Sedimenticola thiotaurini TaxID=1543721 RepID=A0A0F7K3G3_9GAMM|nr:RDD family protein [Sedimenticola thiotaurini]AKH21770.1 transporter [Sedimenticola thiotaurini]